MDKIDERIIRAKALAKSVYENLEYWHRPTAHFSCIEHQCQWQALKSEK